MNDLRNQAAPPAARFPVVGIGASAGGFDALRRLLQGMPSEPGVAIVVVQHLARDRPSLAPELLAKFTDLHVREVDDELVVEPGTVYLIPPGKFLRISGGRLHLSQMEGPRAAPVAIDYFLRSLAEDQQQRAIGVILSGTGSDGTLGIKAIKQHGGFVIVQDTRSAEQSGMPASAIGTGLVDQVLPPEEIPAAVLRFAKHPYVRGVSEISEETSGVGEDLNWTEVDDQGLNAIVELLYREIERDFRHYKPATLLRRTRRRMCLAHTNSFSEYLAMLENDPVEQMALSRDLLVSVTDFMRDPEAWLELSKSVLPEIVRERSTGEPGPSAAGEPTGRVSLATDKVVRVWVPGCATGEEAYTVAMLLMEEIRRQRAACSVQVFASDVDKSALQEARQGHYPTSITADLTAEQLERYFTLRDGELHYQVGKRLRDAVMFAEQSLISDPPFSQLDLICCRNVLIYLKPHVQHNVVGLFHFALRQGGHLMLGTAETVGRQEDLFQPVSKRWRIYRGIGATRHDRFELPLIGSGLRSPAKPLKIPARDPAFSRFTQSQLLDLIAPRAVLVDAEGRILYVTGNVDPYLTWQPGVPNDDLLSKVRDGLRSQLRVAVRKAMAEKSVVHFRCRIARDQQEWQDTRVEVRHVFDERRSQSFTLVVFDCEPKSTGDKGEEELSRPTSKHPAVPTSVDPANVSDLTPGDLIRQLEEELVATKADLRLTIEQHLSSEEEFNVANEEVMSVNEELQSTNEELETSKEELQSLNDELASVNEQLAEKVVELETKHADLENLISATELATICLDEAMTIRWFTKAASRVFRIRGSDIGRPLSDLQHDINDSQLAVECGDVMRNQTSIENEVHGSDGRMFIRRVVPYRNEEQRVGGVVITFVDITSRRRHEEELRASEAQLRDTNERLRMAAAAARFGWYSYEAETRELVWSGELRAISELRDDEPINLDRVHELIHPDDLERYREHTNRALQDEAASVYRGEFRVVLGSGRTLWFEDRGRVVWGGDGAERHPLYAVGMVMDVTDRKAAEEQLVELNNTLEHLVSQRTEVLEILQHVTRSANESQSVDDAVLSALVRIAAVNGWCIGHVWRLADDAPDGEPAGPLEMKSAGIWHVTADEAFDGRRLRRFKQQSERHRFVAGEGLVGQVFESGQPRWISDLTSSDEPRREDFVALGIRGAVALPITIDDKVVAVMEFLADDVAEPSSRFLDVIGDIGIQLGHVIRRKRLEQAVAEIANKGQQRIGRELHDSLAQELTGGALIAESLRRNLPPEPAANLENVRHLVEILQQAHQNVRHLSSGLMMGSMNAADLSSVLKGLAVEIRERFDVACAVVDDDFEGLFVQNDMVALVIYQIAREAVHNAVKHADAGQLTIRVANTSDTFRLEVRDDGQGFDVGRRKMNSNGLLIMRYRAESIGGEFAIESNRETGTRVILSIPRRVCQP